MEATTIQDIINRRVEIGLSDLLLKLYHAGYCAGARLPLELPGEAGVTDLILLVEARHRVEVRAPRGWEDAPVTNDNLPGWLLSLPQQADPVRLLAAAERENALGDSLPPAGVL